MHEMPLELKTYRPVHKAAQKFVFLDSNTKKSKNSTQNTCELLCRLLTRVGHQHAPCISTNIDGLAKHARLNELQLHGGQTRKTQRIATSRDDGKASV